MEKSELTVDFDGREVIYGFTELDELVLVYTTTIHKSQGSEYPAVVLPLTTQHCPMLQRNLVYTGVTRGKHNAPYRSGSRGRNRRGSGRRLHRSLRSGHRCRGSAPEKRCSRNTNHFAVIDGEAVTVSVPVSLCARSRRTGPPRDRLQRMDLMHPHLNATSRMSSRL